MSSSELVSVPQGPGGDADKVVSSGALQRIASSVPPETRRAYARDWSRFSAWCNDQGRTALPATPETLAEYANALADAGKAPASIMRAIAAIRVIHKISAHPPPETKPARDVVTAYRVERADAGTSNRNPAAALSVRQVKAIAESLAGDDSITGLRDRLIFVLGWAMMARRGELHRLNIADVKEVQQGLDVTVRRTKTDQRAEGRRVAIPYGSDPLTCPVRLMRSWLAVLASRGITHGPLFRRIDRHGNIGGEPEAGIAGQPRGDDDGRLTPEGIWFVVRRAVRRAGLPEPGIKPHSLRAGGATGAYLGGADLLSIGRHGGWQDGSAVLTGYIRDVDRWKKNPMHGAGL